MKSASAVAIFNMALSCHLQHCVADSCFKMDVLADRAMALYTQAATLLEECQIQPQETVYLVYLALCRNLIEVSLTQGYVYQARQWKERLDETIQRAVGSGGGPHSETAAESLLSYFKDTQEIYTGTFVAAQAA